MNFWISLEFIMITVKHGDFREKKTFKKTHRRRRRMVRENVCLAVFTEPIYLFWPSELNAPKDVMYDEA